MHAVTSREVSLVSIVLQEANGIGKLEWLVHRQNRDGFTALHFAVAEGCRDMMRLLIDKGADPYKGRVQGRSLLGPIQFS